MKASRHFFVCLICMIVLVSIPCIVQADNMGTINPGECRGRLPENPLLAGGLDSYTFSGETGEGVAISMSSGAINPQIFLYDPDGTLETSTPGGNYAHVMIQEHQLLQTGTYTIIVKDYGGNHSGAYSLSFMLVPGLTDGGEIVSGEVKATTLECNADLDGYTFSGETGEGVAISMSSGSLNPYVLLYAPDGTLEASTPGGNYAHVMIQEHQLLQTGTYTIIVKDYGGNNSGTYSLSLILVPETEPVINPGDCVIQTLTYSGELDAYTFNGEVGKTVLISMSSGSLNPQIFLYDPDGTLETSTPGGNYAHVMIQEHQLLQTGTYTIIVKDYGGNHSGAYSLSFMLVPGLTDGGEIVSGEVKATTLECNADLDGYTFSGETGEGVAISMSSGSLNPYILLYAPDGTLETSTPGGNYAHVMIQEHQLLQTGTYTIIVKDYGGNNSGTYSLSLILVPETEPVINPGDCVIQTLTYSGELDAYTFNGEVGKTVLISMSSGSLNPQIFLYDPDGTLETSTPGGNYAHVMIQEHQLLQTGTYTIIVKDYGGNHSGAYSLSFMLVPGLTDGGYICSGEIKQDTLECNADLDSYIFNGEVGKTVLISMSSGSLNPYILLYAPDGTLEKSTPGGNFAHVEIPDHQLLQTGTYTVVVKDYGGNNSGTYTLSLSMILEEDTDSDGVGNTCDNCLEKPNGPDGGTCTSGTVGAFCMSDFECGTFGFCSMDQEDSDGNGIGDACDDVCICDVSGDGTITPQDALCAFQKYLGICPSSCGPCAVVCGDINGDDITTPADALCIFQEYLGIGCEHCN